MKSTILLAFIITHLFAADPNDASNEQRDKKHYPSKVGLGRVGDYGYPNNPLYDRAKGYLLKGKVKNVVSNSGNFITWDYHPAGSWGEYGYLPHVGFIAGVPGHEYSSHWSSPGNPSWIQDGANNSIWYSEDAYDAWVDDIVDPETETGNYKTIVYNTVVDIGTDDKGHNDRGDIALELTDYCDGELCRDINNCAELVCINEGDCESAGYTWVNVGIAQFDEGGGTQWFLDHELDRLYFYLDDSSLDPNYASSGIGLAFPWSIRPKFKSRTEVEGGFYLDLYDYGEDLEEWTCEDNYAYFGANFDESWFIRDGGSGVAVKTDWQATTAARYNSHNLDNTAGDLFGDTEFTDNADPGNLLAHSAYPATWPKKHSFDTGNDEPFWPGWWADEYYGESPNVWPSVGIYNCNGTRSDDDCWKPLPGRHISDMDIYMEFDDRWANVGNDVLDNEYVAAGYPMGIKVLSMAHSYGVAYAEDVMFVTVTVRNESGDYCAFEKDKNGIKIQVKDENNNVICNDGMIMPDGTKLNRGKGFSYKKLYMGFYMDADVLSTDATGGYSVHTNEDDFMKYIDCKISKDEYPDGCPVVNNDTLRISMAVIGDYDGRSNAATGYSMDTGENEGPDFGVVAVQLLDSPYSTGYIDLDEDGFYDIYPGEKLKMTDWHWFDWYNRPGVLSGQQVSDAPALNKELIQYQVIAGDNTNLTSSEKARYFHSDNPETDYDSEINPHFDSLEGIKQTSFFTTDPEGLDCVLEMSSGPFDLAVGEQVSFSFSIIFGQNIDDLLNNAYFSQIMYNSHYQGYTPPITPQVAVKTTGHEKITIYWTNFSETSGDIITGYKDFEGYKIYKSTNNGSAWSALEDEIIIENVSVGWQPYAQFDLSAEEDSVFCIFGKNVDGFCISGDNCDDPCIRNRSFEGPASLAPWFDLGNNTGFGAIRLEPPDTIDGIIYNYAFIDSNVYAEDGSLIEAKIVESMQYTYSVVAYDIGVPDSWEDPEGWGMINPFPPLENSKGTTIHDKNFATVNYYSPFSGCTYNTACNYEETAIIDDGSCIFPDACDNCEGDCVDDGTGFVTCSTSENNKVVADECGMCNGVGIADGACDCDGNTPTDLFGSDNYDCSGNQLSLYNGLIPEDYSIHNIYPNPFNPITNIIYGLPEYTNVQIVIFDLSGKRVASLINEFQSPGYHSINWNADSHPSGMYFIKMIAGEYVNTQKLMLVK